MLIEVERDIISEAVKHRGDAVNKAREILLSLMLANRRGQHIVWIPSVVNFNTKEWQQIQELIGEQNVQILKKVTSKRLEISAVLGKVNCYCVVSYIKPHNLTTNQIWINPAIYHEFRFDEETHLITENLLDADFYRHAVLYFKRNNNLRNAKIMYYPLNGGGITTHQVLELELNRRRNFCLTIVDSDKHCPTGKRGQTCLDVENKYREYRKSDLASHAKLYDLKNVAEIENLIPENILRKEGAITQDSSIDVLVVDWSYYDVKHGLKVTSIDCAKTLTHLQTLYPMLNFDDLNDLWDKKKNKDEFYKKAKDKGIETIIKTRWGADILKRCEDKYASNLNSVTSVELSQYQQEEWNSIGKEIYTWCCCLSFYI